MKNFIEIGTTEEQQVEQIKQWIKENGLQIIIGISLGLGSIWGWNYFKDYQYQQAIAARSAYLSMVSADDVKNLSELKSNHTNSTYAQQGEFIAAKYALDGGDKKQALEHLLPLINAENNEFIVHTAKLRAASIYLELGDFEQALGVIGEVKNNAFSGLYHHLTADIYLAKNDQNLAKEYYQLALDELPANSKLKELIKIKLDDLN
ncbi:MAG: tetratricopeptide repeat protein [Candidatus Thioglobus sp.]|nr:tetratricopeptide repeat protein [Candidatus Thioglobus sp.]